ncbi:transmembrane protein 237A-like isoform X2 [Halichondria panicea]|uniref:transmembrane protein 237A-like isoform X2 n=1 Tax=Halichondria panicea TaxID=6063 RepID=UPI00312BCB4B
MAASSEAVGAVRQEITSPGPLHMSDLDMSPTGPPVPLPRLLEPLKQPKKKRKKRKRGEPLSLSEQPPESLLGDALRNQLRSRLDPIYNPPPAQTKGVTTPTLGSDSEREHGMREEGLLSEGTAEEDLPTHAQTTEDEGPPGVRQLPALPPDTEDPPQSSLADQLASGRITDTIEPMNGIQAYLSEEDVVDVTAEDHVTQTFTLPHPHHAHTTHDDDVIFVERRDGRGFVAQRRGQSDPSLRKGAGLAWMDREVTSGQVTLFVHSQVQKVSLSAHGLLAGLALWDCVVVHVLAGQTDRHVSLLTAYNSLSLPVHAVYLFLLLLVTVSLCDRLDLARIDRLCLKSFIYPSQLFVFIALLLVLLALVLTLSLTAIDERISLYPLLPTLWLDILEAVNASSSPLSATHTVEGVVYIPSSPSPESSLVTSWLSVVTVRAVLCIGSWLLTVWVTRTDRLQDYLRNIESDDTRKVG